ncbi:ABC transporter permease [Prevotella sp. 10(H)]|uniref:ABC transporter permease n=1 Tax=Prevotella sp. 10(H) TaxID=1158294 RepID=UPI0004A7494B|nr:ABC transporter permease [Prevotella sp. 10(H)]
MYKVYFKQAISMLKQNRFISIITIAGTALAIMMIMVLIVSESIKNISISPEANRERTMYFWHEIKNRKNGQGTNTNGVISYYVYKNYLSEIKTPELISIQNNAWNKSQVTANESSKDRVAFELKSTDANFWKLMSLSFIEGNPFTEEDFQAGLKKAVISEKVAKRLYGNESAMGKTINIDFKNYTVAGIVKNVAPIFKYATSDIYIPYTSRQKYEEGSYQVLFLAADKNDFDKISEEVRAAERKFNSTDEEWNLTLNGPYSHSTHLLKNSTDGPDVKGNTRKIVFVLAVLLFVPAINLSSFSLSRIKRRMEEIGVRKAFGAKKYIILIQVLYENLITSLIGGIIGLILSFAVVIWLKQWLLGVGQETAIPLNSLVSAPVFIAVFLACVLLNLLSAGIPAYRASKVNIVDSLNRNNI